MKTTTNDTNRLDRVIKSQRRLMLVNAATTLTLMMGFGATIIGMF
jgi:hypothetical protein